VRSFDVAIIGGGPAGTATAILLAREGFSVVVLEASLYRNNLAGHMLPPTIAERLRLLNVFDRFVQQPQCSAAGILSAWGNSQLDVNDFMFGANGSGWQVDREIFDIMLARSATAAGAIVWTDSRLLNSPRRQRRAWAFDVNHGGKCLRSTCRFLIDASGRSGTALLAHLSPRIVIDRLIGVAWIGKDREEWPYPLVESVEDGWFYCGSLPGRQTTIIYLTDSDLYRQKFRGSRDPWWHELRRTTHARERFPGGATATNLKILSAASTVRVEPAGEAWCAVGDAALSPDPLSGLGVQQAIDSAEQAANAVKRNLEYGEAPNEYRDWIHQTLRGYLRAREQCYSSEKRWPASAFWQRRLGSPSAGIERF